MKHLWLSLISVIPALVAIAPSDAHAAPPASCTAFGTWNGAFATLPGTDPTPDFNGGVDACVRIEPEACVLFDAASEIHVDSLLVEGGMMFMDTAERTIDAHKIVVGPEAAFVVGTQSDRFDNDANIELTDGLDCDASGGGVYTISDDGTGNLVASWSAAPADLSDFHPMDHMTHTTEPNASLLVMGGELQLHGRERTSTWTTLAATVPDEVGNFDVLEADSWDEGDEIVLTSTDFDQGLAEKFIVADVTATGGNDSIVILGDTAYEHFSGQVGSSVPGFPDVYENGEVALLSHNIKVSNPEWSSSTSLGPCGNGLYTFGAEIKATRHMGHAPIMKLQNIEVSEAGKFNQMGHYPIHFHHAADVEGSYIRGVSVHDSANRAIVLHGTQRALVEDNVVSDIVGHAYYLERSGTWDTKHNTLTANIGMSVFDCNPLDHGAVGSSGAAVFYFEDHRNSFVGNVAAGSAFAGFYDAQAGSMKSSEDDSDLDDYYMCGDDVVDYSVASPGLPLDTAAFSYANTWYDATQYETWGYTTPTVPVNCEGAFVDNVVHSTQNGYYADEHRNTFMRILGLSAWKNARRATMIKNKGATEMIELMAADNGSAVWPASHAYHQWSAPSYLLAASHLIGLSANLGTTLYPNDDPTYDIYGVEVYEGRVHVADTRMELFTPSGGARNVAAFGRHRSFPFYTNNVDNSVRNISLDAASQRLYFEDPGFRENGEAVSHAAGYASVMLVDSDGSLVPSGTPSIITAAHDFIISGDTTAPDPIASQPAGWNAYVMSTSDIRYGQVILRWCDVTSPLECNAYFAGSLLPSLAWTQEDQGSGAFGFVEGLHIVDLSDGDVVTSDHAPQGLHTRLGANVIAGHDYALSLWANDGPVVVLDETAGELDEIEAMEVQYRFAPTADAITLSIPVPASPASISVIYGDDPFATAVPSTLVATPASTEQWAFEDTATDRRVHLYLQPAVERETVSVLMGFGNQ